jgi:hypothetical protein
VSFESYECPRASGRNFRARESIHAPWAIGLAVGRENEGISDADRFLPVAVPF